MTEYHKIQSIFKREEAKPRRLIEGAWTLPEFEYLANNLWEFTEKVDGTNIRVIINPAASASERVTFKGRTDAASIPATLVTRLQALFMPQSDKLCGIFSDGGILYGEGYGARIQKGGGNYRSDQDFILFDVKVPGVNGHQWWLLRDSIEDIAAACDLDTVPVIGTGTLYGAIDICKDGLQSTWGNFEAEGIVARPMVPLVTRAGHRIITKIKCIDFK